MDVLFVCLENVCRSPIAQVIAQGWRGITGPDATSRHRFRSAGTRAALKGAPIDPRARAALERRGYVIETNHRARTLVPAELARHDLVVAMDAAVLRSLRQLCPAGHAHKLSLLLDWAPAHRGEDVPDPYFGPDSGFDTVVTLCEQGLAGLFAEALSRSKHSAPSRRGGPPGEPGASSR